MSGRFPAWAPQRIYVMEPSDRDPSWSTSPIQPGTVIYVRVDTLEWANGEIRRLIRERDEARTEVEMLRAVPTRPYL